MALDAELLDRFERDWNDAMANYEARTTATRLADTSVAPWARTQIAPEAAASLQSELLAPIQAKWDILREGARRSSAAPQIGDVDWSSPMNLGLGEVARFNQFGKKEVLSPARPKSENAKERTLSVVVGEDMLGRPTRLNMTGPEFQSWFKTAPPAIRENAVNEAIRQMLPPSWEVNPETIPSGSPTTMTAPARPPVGFIGEPGGENLFDPMAISSTNAPMATPPAASSIKRFKWVQGQLQPQ